MELHSINTGTFKLDGGAMFGVVPKVMWNKVYPADENNLCTWALRCLLVEHNDRKVLIDCGIGNKQDEKFLKHYYLSGENNIRASLLESGFQADSITDVVLTHLHFDHCGGAVSYNENRTKLEPTFKNATYWVGKQQWELANNPNQREKASYLKDNFVPLNENNQLKFIKSNSGLFEGFDIRICHGHTAGQIIPFIQYKNRTVVYMADFIPSSVHIPLPFVISYDTQPLVSLSEKEQFLAEAVKNNYILFFEHDYYHECCDLHDTEKGIRPNSYFEINNLI